MSEWRRMYPHKPVLCVADALGAPPRTVEKWFSGESRPSLDMLPAIMTAWGPEFLCAALSEPPGWLTRAVQDERREALRRQQAELDAELREIGA